MEVVKTNDAARSSTGCSVGKHDVVRAGRFTIQGIG